MKLGMRDQYQVQMCKTFFLCGLGHSVQSYGPFDIHVQQVHLITNVLSVIV